MSWWLILSGFLLLIGLLLIWRVLWHLYNIKAKLKQNHGASQTAEALPEQHALESLIKMHIPKILPETLSSQELNIFNRLNTDAFEEALARKVTEKLINNPATHNGLYFSHRDYCGIGIFLDKEQFILSNVYDGYGPDMTIASCDSKVDFTHWLAQQSDQSMSLFGEQFNNQTITKLRLEWYLEDSYSPVWNDFWIYERERLGQK